MVIICQLYNCDDCDDDDDDSDNGGDSDSNNRRFIDGCPVDDSLVAASLSVGRTFSKRS